MSDATVVVRVSQQALAEQVQAFLQDRHIGCDVVQSSDAEWQVKVHFPAQRSQAVTLVNQWLGGLQKQQSDYLWQHGEPVKIRRQGKRNMDWLHQARRAPFMSLVLLLCSVSFLAAFSLWFEPVRELLRFAPVAELVQTQQWWRLLAPAFMHFSFIHFAFNLMWWWLLGGMVERRFGTTALVVLFLLTALSSNVAQYFDTGSNFGGLSGVVYGLFGFVWWIGWLRPEWGVGLPRHLIGFMLVWLAIGYADLLPVSVANTAHSVGLIAGCALASAVSLIGRRHS